MTSLREFRRACHKAARRTGGRIVEFRIADGVTPNFHQGVLDHGGHHRSIVCTRDRAEPVVAIAEPRVIDGTAVGWGPLTFVEAPELVAVLAEFPAFQVLTPADLEYWAPVDLGEGLFNYWD
ncbi:hypothetical protein DMA12_46635 [Amycolatopsis balhimycina DSM 5908]|uniref:Uncharacterized protein n=1 Tax=Amycolatopsis balhimycina DSM 5908 TaxID=1081091 RepID=A0A428VVI0_AMYBA|nr:hypothetical protein [Amycolatopsis balhimycina]RSM34835.1 hypothetical protein DMA12_46635 [Amycolatopsis balhimycina DSM 5908]